MASNGKFKIKGKHIPDFDSDIEVDIGSNNVGNHDVTDKPIPDPTPYQGGTITWFVAFAVKEKSNGSYANINYTVTLNELPKGKKLFVLLSSGIEEVATHSAGSGKIKFTLAIGDPPLGMGP
jgi:hypothetical protein